MSYVNWEIAEYMWMDDHRLKRMRNKFNGSGGTFSAKSRDRHKLSSLIEFFVDTSTSLRIEFCADRPNL